MQVAKIFIDGAIVPTESAKDNGAYGTSLAYVRRQVKQQGEFDILEVYINSPGGDVDEGYAIHDYLVSLGNIKTIVTGSCYSIATIIFLAGKERILSPNSKLMIHCPWGQVQGDADTVRKYADMLESAQSKIKMTYKSFLKNIQEDELDVLLKNETYITSQEAVEMGLATSTMEPSPAVFNLKIINETSNKKTNLFMGLKNLFARVKNLTSGRIKNLNYKLADGSEIYVDSEQELKVGDMVYSVDTQEVSADGDYQLEDGRMIVVKDGMIAEIKEAASASKNSEMEALKAELEALKAAVLEKEQAKAQEEKSKEEASLRAEIDALKTALSETVGALNISVKDVSREKASEGEILVKFKKGSVAERAAKAAGIKVINY